MIVSVLVGLYCVLMGTVLVRRGVASWRRGVSYRERLGSLLGHGGRAGLERALLTGGVFHYLLGAVMVLVAYLRATGHGGTTPAARPSATLGVLAVVLLAGVVVSGWSMITITLFNRPRFLVPPHLRHERGTLALRRGRPVHRAQKASHD